MRRSSVYFVLPYHRTYVRSFGSVMPWCPFVPLLLVSSAAGQFKFELSMLIQIHLSHWYACTFVFAGHRCSFDQFYSVPFCTRFLSNDRVLSVSSCFHHGCSAASFVVMLRFVLFVPVAHMPLFSLFLFLFLLLSVRGRFCIGAIPLLVSCFLVWFPLL